RSHMVCGCEIHCCQYIMCPLVQALYRAKKTGPYDLAWLSNGPILVYPEFPHTRPECGTVHSQQARGAVGSSENSACAVDRLLDQTSLRFGQSWKRAHHGF